METPRTSVTSADFVRRFGMWQDRAAMRPVIVTHHGRERLVVLSAQQYETLSLRASQGGRVVAEPMAPRFGALLDRLSQGFVSVDRDMIVTEVNAAAAAYWRLDRERLAGTRLTDPLPGLGRTPLYGHLLRAIEAGETAAFDQPNPAYPGRWLRCETMPYLDGAAVLFRDVTDEIARQARAEELDAIAAATMAHGGIGRARLSARGLLVEVDRPLALMADRDPAALTGSRMTDLVPFARRREAADALEAALTDGRPISFRSALAIEGDADRPVRITFTRIPGDRAGGAATMLVTPEREGA
jgi:PAS domain-containing protein